MIVESNQNLKTIDYSTVFTCLFIVQRYKFLSNVPEDYRDLVVIVVLIYGKHFYIL